MCRLFVYLFDLGGGNFSVFLHGMNFLTQACNSLNKRQYRFSKGSQTDRQGRANMASGLQ